MRLRNKTLIIGAASVLALSACTDPAYQQGGERQRTGQGAAIGAAIGGLLGATRESGSDRVRNAAVGAAIGAAAGFGMVLAALIKTFVSQDVMQTWFGATLVGLGLTLVAATVIEVCSEGLLPVAADLLTRANAPGNAFTFMTAGVSTDYTEIMVLKDTTKSWKLALILPLITIPQILVLGYILNLANL